VNALNAHVPYVFVNRFVSIMVWQTLTHLCRETGFYVTPLHKLQSEKTFRDSGDIHNNI
jgi:hypothetical protein